jgi:hypothetical protein
LLKASSPDFIIGNYAAGVIDGLHKFNSKTGATDPLKGLNAPPVGLRGRMWATWLFSSGTRAKNRLLVEELESAQKMWAELGSFAALRMTLKAKERTKQKIERSKRSNVTNAVCEERQWLFI